MIDDRFELVDRLGGGGMGMVWRARDLALHRDVALKEVRPPDPALAEYDPQAARTLRARVLREARALARVDHPNVVTIHHIVDGGEDAYPWIVMELVSGGSLQGRLDRGPMTPAEAARLGDGILAALRATHAVGIEHRDVKPANVLLRKDGRPVLTDFGIAAIRESTSLTATGSIIGSPDYMAPERVRGQAGGPAADFWSLGMLLYVAVEGHHPLRRANTLATLAAVLNDEVPPPRKAGPLTEILTLLLVRDPGARPDAGTLDRMLTTAIAQGEAASAGSASGAAWAGAGAGAGRAGAASASATTGPMSTADLGDTAPAPGPADTTSGARPGPHPSATGSGPVRDSSVTSFPLAPPSGERPGAGQGTAARGGAGTSGSTGTGARAGAGTGTADAVPNSTGTGTAGPRATGSGTAGTGTGTSARAGAGTGARTTGAHTTGSGTAGRGGPGGGASYRISPPAAPDPDPDAARRRVRTRKWATVGMVALAAVLTGVLLYVLLPRPDDRDGAPTARETPGPGTSATASGPAAPQRDASAAPPSPSFGDAGDGDADADADQPETNLLTPAGIRQALAELRPLMDSGKVISLVVYPEHVSAEALVKGSTKRYDRFSYRADSGATRDGAGGTKTTGTQPVDLNAFDWDALPALMRKADQVLGVDQPTSRYLVVRAPSSVFDEGQSMSVYLSDAYGSGYLKADPKGKVIATYPQDK
ncbi:serine/threonine-protein kinase [Streptomyces buecherae]|uniref:serine/threonine-protein kinase n=1 Tax=Streptomyces buecherae TaxID=2763006 RepID=UPI0037A7B724